MRVSYCSTCKGRLWQLKLTMAENLKALKNIDAEWIILDYNCPDNVSEVIRELPMAQEALSSGKLKLYKLDGSYDWSITAAKNLTHSLASGDILFNLDIDNYIGSSFEDLDGLAANQFLWAGANGILKGYGGRIGIHREDFMSLGGYNQELIVGAANLVERLKRLGYQTVSETDPWEPVNNTKEQRVEYLPGSDTFMERYRLAHVKSMYQLLSMHYRMDPELMGVLNGVDLKQHVVRVA